MTEPHRVRVAVETPLHSGLSGLLDYTCERALAPGTLVRVPLGQREVPGVVWPSATESVVSGSAEAEAIKDSGKPVVLRSITAVLEALPPMSPSWCLLADFAAGYYQRSVGEVALSLLPPELRKLDNTQLARRLAKLEKAKSEASRSALGREARPELSIEQQQTLQRLEDASRSDPATTALLFGATGSGKTEVYLRAAEQVLNRGHQVMVMVPEINLTPQLEARFAARFEGSCIVSLHSDLTPAQRLKNWLLAHLGLADLVLGTRLAVFASMPRLGLIVVDEEHDPSYKQQEGARYSARDLAVVRGKRERIPVLLGSATPSLETWQRCNEGRYLRLAMPGRIGHGPLPRVRVVDMNTQPRGSQGASGNGSALSPPLLAALQARIDAGEQSLVFLNRRGYAPVLFCSDCGWKSACPHCSAWRVFHKLDRTLRCHHCGFTQRVPRACPDCGNLDISPMGRGTEKLEEQLAALLRARGATSNDVPARVARIDADSTRLKGSLQAQLSAVHAGDVDVLVGTQMITKGHDFRRITLVAAVNPDTSLFSSDFRAPERLFAQLMQAAGRAGRDSALATNSEMWIQTWHPTHPLYQALKMHDYESFAKSQLLEREMAGLPPYSHLALLRAEAKTTEAARDFLNAAAQMAASLPGAETLMLYPPVPTTIARVANIERMQMLVEGSSRVSLQRFLAQWLPLLHGLKHQRTDPRGRILRWTLDVDPLSI